MHGVSAMPQVPCRWTEAAMHLMQTSPDASLQTAHSTPTTHRPGTMSARQECTCIRLLKSCAAVRRVHSHGCGGLYDLSRCLHDALILTPAADLGLVQRHWTLVQRRWVPELWQVWT